MSHWKQLEDDLREQILTKEATMIERTLYGELFEIRAPLTGPNSQVLRLRTVWMKESASGLTKFITLYPDKRRKS